jgi:histidinol-phosphate aminotransferase
MKSVRELAQPVSEGYAPYAWSASIAEVAARHGLSPEVILKFDQNTPPLPGVPQVPLAESMAHLNEYPEGTYRELREAAASYTGVRADNVVIGAGADDLILLLAAVFLGEGKTAAIAPPTYPLYRVASQLHCAQIVDVGGPADLRWVCNPNNPTGTLVEPEEVAELARSLPRTIVVCDEAYVEYGGRSVAPWIDELPNLVVIRTLAKAFGLAALRVGYALAHEDTAALLTERRAPAPIATPAARIAAAALREPRLGDVEETIVERERMRSALIAADYDCPAVAANYVLIRTSEPLGERLEEHGYVVRVFPDAIRVTVRRPAENDLLLRALGAEPGPFAGREAVVVRTTTETALRLTLTLDGTGRSRIATGIGFLDHLLTLLSFHAGFDLELLAGGDLDVDEHHTVEDVLASLGTALSQALGGREGVTRYGSAFIPMDEARAIAAVDLVRRAHAEVDLRFSGDRVGALAVSLLGHALERFTMEAGCTVHLEASGADDHHVAEAAFKALGQALRQAVSVTGDGIRSTKGLA